jgi:hypothetical protein
MTPYRHKRVRLESPAEFQKPHAHRGLRLPMQAHKIMMTKSWKPSSATGERAVGLHRFAQHHSASLAWGWHVAKPGCFGSPAERIVLAESIQSDFVLPLENRKPFGVGLALGLPAVGLAKAGATPHVSVEEMARTKVRPYTQLNRYV